MPKRSDYDMARLERMLQAQYQVIARRAFQQGLRRPPLPITTLPPAA